MKNKEQMNNIINELIKELDIPLGYYKNAVARYRSMEDHFRRPQSTIRDLDPLVYTQGSFRLGTVIHPLSPDEGYDLDIVCRVSANKGSWTQEELKRLVGEEVKSYSRQNSFSEPPAEKRRCWTQQYQDNMDFHMDILPCIPAGERFRLLLLESGADQQIAEAAINITDNTDQNYRVVSPNWPRSNPRGFALWFEQRMDVGGRASSSRRIILESGNGAYKSLGDVPAYELKTPLQRVVQLLKRHRDQMFEGDPEGKPISIIITTLAAQAYRGEGDVAEAVIGVLDRMQDYVSLQKPRIPNPVSFDRDDQREDFADRWNDELERNFWRWLRQAREDFKMLGRAVTVSQITESCNVAFGVNVSSEAAAEALVLEQRVPIAVGITRITKAAPPSWGTK